MQGESLWSYSTMYYIGLSLLTWHSHFSEFTQVLVTFLFIKSLLKKKAYWRHCGPLEISPKRYVFLTLLWGRNLVILFPNIILTSVTHIEQMLPSVSVNTEWKRRMDIQCASLLPPLLLLFQGKIIWKPKFLLLLFFFYIHFRK